MRTGPLTPTCVQHVVRTRHGCGEKTRRLSVRINLPLVCQPPSHSSNRSSARQASQRVHTTHTSQTDTHPYDDDGWAEGRPPRPALECSAGRGGRRNEWLCSHVCLIGSFAEPSASLARFVVSINCVAPTWTSRRTPTPHTQTHTCNYNRPAAIAKGVCLVALSLCSSSFSTRLLAVTQLACQCASLLMPRSARRPHLTTGYATRARLPIAS
mmetsp:Transcript_4120/g.9420  ORF Transcript_4120/g.9420 Transcript_4120/m.9420 type:complete len:212 (-) Transcript_4120:428-1063(-)